MNFGLFQLQALLRYSSYYLAILVKLSCIFISRRGLNTEYSLYPSPSLPGMKRRFHERLIYLRNNHKLTNRYRLVFRNLNFKLRKSNAKSVTKNNSVRVSFTSRGIELIRTGRQTEGLPFLGKVINAANFINLFIPLLRCHSWMIASLITSKLPLYRMVCYRQLLTRASLFMQ